MMQTWRPKDICVRVPGTWTHIIRLKNHERNCSWMEILFNTLNQALQ